MNDTRTAEGLVVPEETTLPSSGDWEFTPQPSSRLSASWSPLRLTAIPLVLAASAFTYSTDPWSGNPQQEAPTTLSSPFKPVTRRRISIAEAYRIAMEILETAEAERLEIAAREAARGIDWEETS